MSEETTTTTTVDVLVVKDSKKNNQEFKLIIRNHRVIVMTEGKEYKMMTRGILPAHPLG